MLSVSTNCFLGFAFLSAGEIDRAMVQAQETLELSPTAHMALQLLAYNYARKGMYDESIFRCTSFRSKVGETGTSIFLPFRL
jgi:lipopolysaccharide biosynthesis regulator YciM